MPPVLSVSVDLDEIASYYQIHGLDPEENPESSSRAIWTTAVPRFLDFFDKLNVKATFFVIGTSLDVDVGIPGVQDIKAAGHEIANHSYSHFYDLLRRGPAQRKDEITRCADIIEKATGSQPKGFRAPGYNIDDELIELLTELGYVYDSSVFPCPAYYLAKAGAMLSIRARGRQSRSILGPKEVLLAPAEPYKTTGKFWKKLTSWRAKRTVNRGVMELPVAVLPGVRTPFIGTSISLAGPKASAVMGLAMLKRKFVGLELHGIDLLDADDDGVRGSALVKHQPDLKVPLDRKFDSYEAAITALTNSGAKIMTCLEAAKHFNSLTK